MEPSAAVGGDISSLLEIAFALNFGYALIRALADYEIRSRLRTASELLELAEKRFNARSSQREECENEYRYFRLEIDTQHPKIRRWSASIVTCCFFLGLSSAVTLLGLEFGWIVLSNCQKITTVLFLILFPLMSALSLWIYSRYLLRTADKYLDALRQIVTSSA